MVLLIYSDEHGIVSNGKLGQQNLADLMHLWIFHSLCPRGGIKIDLCQNRDGTEYIYFERSTTMRIALL